MRSSSSTLLIIYILQPNAKHAGGPSLHFSRAIVSRVLISRGDLLCDLYYLASRVMATSIYRYIWVCVRIEIE